MSVSESENLRDNFFELCNFMRDKAPILKAHCAENELVALRRAAEVLSIAGVCLMNGRHDCPNFIAVNAEKLENCLTTLALLHHVSEQAGNACPTLNPGGNSPF